MKAAAVELDHETPLGPVAVDLEAGDPDVYLGLGRPARSTSSRKRRSSLDLVGGAPVYCGQQGA